MPLADGVVSSETHLAGTDRHRLHRPRRAGGDGAQRLASPLASEVPRGRIKRRALTTSASGMSVVGSPDRQVEAALEARTGSEAEERRASSWPRSSVSRPAGAERTWTLQPGFVPWRAALVEDRRFGQEGPDQLPGMGREVVRLRRCENARDLRRADGRQVYLSVVPRPASSVPLLVHGSQAGSTATGCARLYIATERGGGGQPVSDIRPRRAASFDSARRPPPAGRGFVPARSSSRDQPAAGGLALYTFAVTEGSTSAMRGSGLPSSSAELYGTVTQHVRLIALTPSNRHAPTNRSSEGRQGG